MHVSCARRAGVLTRGSPYAAASLQRRGLHTSAAALRGTKNLDWFFRAQARIEREAQRAANPPPVFPPTVLHAGGRKRARAFLDLAFGAAAAAAVPAAAAGVPAAASTSAAGASPGPALAAPAPSQEPAQQQQVHRVVFELADDIVPMTAENFLRLCERPAGLGGYRGTELFRVQKGFAVFGGDVELNNGRGGRCALGEARHFPDENFIGRHTQPGVLAMANSGVHSNGSVFYVALAPCPQLDGRNVVLGTVLLGLDAFQRAAGAFTVNLRPASPISVADCGRIAEGSAAWAAVDAQLAAAARHAAARVKAAAAKDAAAAAAATAKDATGEKGKGGEEAAGKGKEKDKAKPAKAAAKAAA